MNALNRMIEAEGLSGRVQIHLRTVDAVSRNDPLGGPTTEGPDSVTLQKGYPVPRAVKVPSVASWYNWYQSEYPHGGEIDGPNGEIDGASSSDETDLVKNVDPADFGKHRALIIMIRAKMLQSLGVKLPQ